MVAGIVLIITENYFSGAAEGIPFGGFLQAMLLSMLGSLRFNHPLLCCHAPYAAVTRTYDIDGQF